MNQRRRRLRKLYKKHEKALRQIEARREKLCRKIEAFQKAKAARLQTTRDKCERLEKDRAALERERDTAIAKDKEGALAAVKTKKLAKVDDKLVKLREELEIGESEFGGPESAKIAELELAIEGLDMAERKLTTTITKAKAREMDADIDEEEEDEDDDSEDDGDEDDDDKEEEENVSEEHSDDDSDGGSDDEDAESESEEENVPPEKEVSSVAPVETPSNPFFQIAMPDLNIEDYRKAAVKAVDAELEKRLTVDAKGKVATPVDSTKQKFTMPLDVPEEELLELFQTQIRSSYVEMQCAKISRKATREFLQMREVLQRWSGLGTRAVFEAWHEVARANRLDADAVKARAERKQVLEKQNRELEEQLARVEARRWAQRSDMYTDAIYYENETTGETRWEPPQYWEEEQSLKQKERQSARVDNVPLLKLPPI
ncbi:hypothetical protein PHYBOEH_011768 [Phytophthora boehmeriae]|uniref:WW domain-containing protein n=1 Tax=Phytophthora boehmeriae TaxID=109152 RepID=A0A8T1WW17_9STRA|nr:hypothetical protein PHYBOEH_011768 [Phytophthora boehmeriae]